MANNNVYPRHATTIISVIVVLCFLVTTIILAVFLADWFKITNAIPVKEVIYLALSALFLVTTAVTSIREHRGSVKPSHAFAIHLSLTLIWGIVAILAVIGLTVFSAVCTVVAVDGDLSTAGAVGCAIYISFYAFIIIGWVFLLASTIVDGVAMSRAKRLARSNYVTNGNVAYTENGIKGPQVMQQPIYT